MIVCFGSLNVDFVFELAEMPQPGQTLLAERFRTEAGGKGANQAVAAARDGADVVMVGAVGGDALAEVALQNLSAVADIGPVARTAEPTGCASILLDGQGRNMIAVAAGANRRAAAASVDDALLRRADFVLMQMETDAGETAALIRRVRAAGGRPILNLAPAYPLAAEILSLCDLVIVNEDEAASLAGWLGCDATARSLSARLGTGVLRTLGGDGAEACVDGAVIRVAAVPVAVVDTTAAGDCFVGVLASALDRGLPLAAAMRRAATAAALACARAGSQASLPFADETDALLAAAVV